MMKGPEDRQDLLSCNKTYTIHMRPSANKKIYLDPLDREGIYLYAGEIKKEGLKEGQEISEEELDRLRLTYAGPRAKKRALAILMRRDQTESQLKEKLVKAQTDSKSLEEAMDFVRDQGYVDDEKYARDYIHSRRTKKSFRQIRADLVRKGISREIMDQVFEEDEGQRSQDLQQLFDRYIRRFGDFDRDAARKTYAHFARKGYASDLITSLIRKQEEMEDKLGWEQE